MTRSDFQKSQSHANYGNRGIKQGHFGAIPNYGSSIIPAKKLIGLQDSFGKTDMSVGTILGDELIQASPRLADELNEYVQGFSFDDKSMGFNWLTGTQMNIYNHERLTYFSSINKKAKFTEPVLKKRKNQSHFSQGN